MRAAPQSPLRSGSCIDQLFAAMPANRIITLEAGAFDQEILGGQSLSEPFALKFTLNRQVVGAMLVNFFIENQLFKLSNVVDGSCAALTDYENADVGGDPNTMQNYTTVHLHIGEQIFALGFNFDTGSVSASFEQIIQ